jgi:hypothetical protein
VDLNTYGLQCMTYGLTGFGVMAIVLVVTIGIARLLSNAIELPDGGDE